MTDIHRLNLKDYYKIIKECNLCKKQYGLDKDKENKKCKNICPVCLGLLYRGNWNG